MFLQACAGRAASHARVQLKFIPNQIFHAPKLLAKVRHTQKGLFKYIFIFLILHSVKGHFSLQELNNLLFSFQLLITWLLVWFSNPHSYHKTLNLNKISTNIECGCHHRWLLLHLRQEMLLVKCGQKNNLTRKIIQTDVLLMSYLNRLE